MLRQSLLNAGRALQLQPRQLAQDNSTAHRQGAAPQARTARRRRQSVCRHRRMRSRESGRTAIATCRARRSIRPGKLWTIEQGRAAATNSMRPEAGKNYGWPIICYGIDYPGGPIGEGITSKEGMEQPVYYWDPVIAPAGHDLLPGRPVPVEGQHPRSSLAGTIVRLEMRTAKSPARSGCCRIGGVSATFSRRQTARSTS